ncbi:hypothetical protein [Burkholderia cenocepacia]|uniref:hypothetical protein n=1 Tax=Burkholderia cenocepacia TaxID=95486 RepID=UPI0021F4E35E|nr:hypothetical protein [Burkholderia cenocepacia]
MSDVFVEMPVFAAVMSPWSEAICVFAVDSVALVVDSDELVVERVAFVVESVALVVANVELVVERFAFVVDNAAFVAAIEAFVVDRPAFIWPRLTASLACVPFATLMI